MKHFINILVILLLFASAVGIAYEVNISPKESVWGVLYFPLFVMMLLWGEKLYKDYR
jgi:hypothetical protein